MRISRYRRAIIIVSLILFNIIFFNFNGNNVSTPDDSNYNRNLEQDVSTLEFTSINPHNEVVGTISDRTGKIFSVISVSNLNSLINRYEPNLDSQPNLFLQDWNITHANMIFNNLRATNYTRDIETDTTEFIYSSIHGPIYFYQKFSVELSQYVNNVSIFIQDINNPTLFTDENSWEVAILNCSNDNQGSPNVNNTLGVLEKPHPIVYAAHWEIFDFKNSDIGAIFLDVAKTNWTVESGTIKYWFAIRIKIPPDDSQTKGGPKFLYFSPDGEDSNDIGEGDTFAINPSFFTDKYYTNHAVENSTVYGNHTEYYSQFYVGNLSSFVKMDNDRYFAESNITAPFNLTIVEVKYYMKELTGNGVTFEDIADPVKIDEMNWWSEHYRYINNINISYALNCSIEPDNFIFTYMRLKNNTGGFEPRFQIYPMNKTTEELFEIDISDAFTKWYIINNYMNFTDNNSITFQFVLASQVAFNTTVNQLTVRVRELPVLDSMIPHDPLLQDLNYASYVSVVNGTTSMSATDAIESLNTIDEKRYNVSATTTNVSIEFKFNVLSELQSSIFNVTDLEDWVFKQPNPIVPQIDIRITSNVSVYNKNSLNESVLEVYKGDKNNTYFTAEQNSSTWIRLDELGNNSYAFNQEITNITYLDPFTTWIFMQLVNVSDDNSIRFRLRYVGNETFQNFNVSINEFALIIYVQNAISSDITSKLGFGLNSNTLKSTDIQLKNFGISVSDNGIWERDISSGIPTQGIYSFDVTSIWPEVRFDVSGTYSIEKSQDFDWEYSLTYNNTKILWNIVADVAYYTYYNTIQDSRGLQFNVPSNWTFMATYNYSSSPPDNSGGWYSTNQTNGLFKTIKVYNISDGNWMIAMNSSTNMLLFNLDSPSNVFIDDYITSDIQIPAFYGGDIYFEIYNEDSTIIFNKSTSLNASAYENSTSYIWDIYSTTRTPGIYSLKTYWIFSNNTHAFLALNTTEINVTKHIVNLEVLNIERFDGTYIIGKKILIKGRLKFNETGEIIEGETVSVKIYDNSMKLIIIKSDITNNEGLIQIEYSLPSGYKSISISLVYNTTDSIFTQAISAQSIEIDLISQSEYNFNIFLNFLPYIGIALGILVSTVVIVKYRKSKLRRFWAGEAMILDDLLKVSYIVIIHKDVGVSIYDKQISLDLNADLIAGFLQAISAFRSEIKSDTPGPITSKGFEMDYYDLKIVIMDRDFIRVALILEGIPSEKLKENQWLFTEQFEKRHEEILKNFTGDVKPFRATDDLIEKYFNITFVYPLKLGVHFGVIKLKGLEKDLIEVAEQILKERKFFFISSLLNFALAGRKASRDEIISTIIALKRKGIIEPMKLG